MAAAREDNGRTQQQLGSCLTQPHTRASIANLEAGKQRVLAHALVELAAALGKSPFELLLPMTSSNAAHVIGKDVALLDISPEEKGQLLELLGLSGAKGGAQS